MGLEEIICLAIKYKVLKIKAFNYEIELDKAALQEVVEQPKLSVPIGEAMGMPTNDEMLFWSAGGIDIEAKPPQE